MREPSHKTFIQRFLNWERVQERLDRYKYIGSTYPITELRRCSDRSPFYCHYMTWRLGVWESEELFQFLDNLLQTSIGLPGWDNNSRVPGGCEFDKFWGFVWELQAANFFANILDIKTEWRKNGPDLYLLVGSKAFYVECTTYRKSFGIEEFISELFNCIYPEIKISHSLYTQFSLPRDNGIETFLDELFKPYLDPFFIDSKLEEVQHRTPVLLPIPPRVQNLYIYLENQVAADHNFELEQILSGTGDPDSYLKTVISEIIINKATSNNLPQNRYNLLMVNLLLSKDWQLAKTLRQMPSPDLGDTIDGVMLTSCGIDKLPTFQSSVIYYKPGHPLEELLGSRQNMQKQPSNNLLIYPP